MKEQKRFRDAGPGRRSRMEGESNRRGVEQTPIKEQEGVERGGASYAEAEWNSKEVEQKRLRDAAPLR